MEQNIKEGPASDPLEFLGSAAIHHQRVEKYRKNKREE